MSGFTYNIDLRVTGQRQLGTATSMVGALDDKVDGLKGAFTRAGSAQDNFIRRGNEGFAGMSNGLSTLAARLGAVAFGFKSIRNAADLESAETSLEFSTAGEGAENMAFLRQTADDLKISLRTSIPAFKQWMGSVRGTSLEGEQARKVFYGVSMASRVMGLGADESAGALFALGQMASKGKVSSEELTQQLGERLPGALALAERAMGLASGQLSKMMDNGELMSDIFLPKFAAQLEKEFASGVEGALGTANAKFAEMDNALFNLESTLGNSLMPTATRLITNFLIPAVNFLGQHMEILPVLGLAYAGVAVGTKAFAISQAMAATSGGVLTKVMGLLNLTMWANPVFLIVGGITALVGGIVVAYNASDKWRGRLFGLWGAIKQVGVVMYTWLIRPLEIVGKLMAAMVSFDLVGMKSAFNEAKGWMGEVKDSFANIGTEFNKGFEAGVKDFNEKKVPTALKPSDAIGSAFGGAAAGASDGAGAKVGSGSADSKIKSGLDGISGAGRPTTINVSIGALVQELNVKTQTMEMGIDKMVRDIERKLIQGINYAIQNQ